VINRLLQYIVNVMKICSDTFLLFLCTLVYYVYVLWWQTFWWGVICVRQVLTSCTCLLLCVSIAFWTLWWCCGLWGNRLLTPASLNTCHSWNKWKLNLGAHCMLDWLISIWWNAIELQQYHDSQPLFLFALRSLICNYRQIIRMEGSWYFWG
jgi:hypothetical protein